MSIGRHDMMGAMGSKVGGRSLGPDVGNLGTDRQSGSTGGWLRLHSSPFSSQTLCDLESDKHEQLR